MVNRKREIVQASLRWMAENGGSDFTSRKIAEIIGISDALIYSHFPTKEKLIIACIEYINELNIDLFNTMIDTVKNIDDPLKMIRTISDIYLEYHIKHWAETLAFEQLRKCVIKEEVREQYKEMQLRSMNLILDGANLRKYVDEIEKTVPLWAWWAHMVQVTLFFVKSVKNGILADCEHTCELFFNILYNGTRNYYIGGR